MEREEQGEGGGRGGEVVGGEGELANGGGRMGQIRRRGGEGRSKEGEEGWDSWEGGEIAKAGEGRVVVPCSQRRQGEGSCCTGWGKPADANQLQQKHASDSRVGF